MSTILGESKYERKALDAYWTHKWVTEWLLNACGKLTSPGKVVWEPACGAGWISDVLSARGYDVLSTDVVDHGYANMQGLQDFMLVEEVDPTIEAIITNPPYDIEKTADDAYRITLATAGFAEGDLEITAQPNLLIVVGRKPEGDEERAFLHHGLAQRNFERRFELAEYVVVKGATYADGLLTIDLAREIPDALRPRRIEIGGHGDAPMSRLERPRGQHAA